MRFSHSRKSVWIGTGAALLCLTLAADDDVKLLPDGPGREATTRVCLDCHGTGNFRKLRLGRDEWADQVAEMVDRGAKGSEKDLAEVVDYLVQNFGPDSKINVNTAPLIELKAILAVTAKEATALLDYREANGKFKDLGDLEKVPGVDPKKIEDKKAIIAF
ncbi:MAG TPA: helix-hairpin-helix domain-containing protein [Bryobacteraceae bacterium]